MNQHLKSLGLYPLPEPTSPENMAAAIPVGIEQLARECIIIETICKETGVGNIEEYTQYGPHLVFYLVKAKQARRYVVAIHQFDPTLNDMDLNSKMGSKPDTENTKFLKADNAEYIVDGDITVGCVPCERVREYFKTIGFGSPEAFLKRIVGENMVMD